ncbi:MAG: DEAD/DEAH box helicase [Myxococcota bacterium]
MGAFDRLHPRLRHAIVHDIGWRSLRPVQEQAAEAILDGKNAVVLAPTAGGKTEASIFPVLSAILTEERPPVAALYICPIRALLNNQELRLRQYTRMVGLEVFKWHGDVSPSQKRSFVADPVHLLMTTPESIEVMLMSSWVDPARVFAGLQAVIIDEVHAFAGDDRGAHLAALLERLSTFCGRDIQRIGLSATVGNPEEIGRWLQGSSQRGFALVDPPKARAERRLTVDYAPEPDVLAAGIARAARGVKSLVFVESRRKAERTAQSLATMRDLDVYVHHSAVSRADREKAEAMFQGGSAAAIVCTSTMELGIDVGDLDRVIQVDAPSRVASYLQRMGRTGRRAETVANCAFFCESGMDLARAVALLRLGHRGWVEDVEPPRRALHVLAHQILALVLQEGGISRFRVLDWLARAAPFVGLASSEVQELVDTMVERDILLEASGRLQLGLKGEKLYGAKNFFELYAVFSSPPLVAVMHGREDVGTVDAGFVRAHDPAQGPLRFRLAGQSWQVKFYDERRGQLFVHPSDIGKAPNWMGMPGTLSYPLCQEIKATLREATPEEDAWLSRAAADELASLRSDYDGLVEPDVTALEETDDGVTWHTFAGGLINRVLVAALQATAGQKWRMGNLGLGGKDIARVDAQRAIEGLRSADLASIGAEAADGFLRGELSKFQVCLPERAERALLVERLLDVDGARRVLGERVVVCGSRGDA